MYCPEDNVKKIEETLDNILVLKYYQENCNQNFFDSISEFILTQPSYYSLAAEVFKKIGQLWNLLEQFFKSTPNQPKEYVWDDDKWIFDAVSEFAEGQSNGELAFDFFQDYIEINSLILLDEPENSLSPKLQKDLSDMLINYARFLGCQFIIATHSPFILSIPGARIYNLDHTPSNVCHWSDLENMQVYMSLFKKLMSDND